jgi:hypothetical protein
MKLKDIQFENKIIQNIRHSNRSGSKKNLFKYHKQNSPEHEDTKYIVYKKLIDEGFSVWCEAIFTTGQRCDLCAIRGKEAYVIEIETPKSKSLMKKKIKEKENYPPEFELIIINSKEFDINKWNL